MANHESSENADLGRVRCSFTMGGNSYFAAFFVLIFLGFDVDLFLFVQEIVTCVLGRV